jgi:hypothetical protein
MKQMSLFSFVNNTYTSFRLDELHQHLHQHGIWDTGRLRSLFFFIILTVLHDTLTLFGSIM